jgi:hypothetical protein
MRNDKWDEERRRDTDDLSSSRRDDDVGAEMPGVGMGGASLAGAGRVYDDLHTRDEVHEEVDVNSQLVHLDDVDEFKVADGDPDIRGWDVRTADGRKIGKVEDLIVDTGLMKVRYIEARLDRDVTRTDGDRHVLIPIGTARLDDDEDDVYLSTSIVDPQQLPEYDRSHFNRDYEVSLRDQFGGTSADLIDEADKDFYRGEMYDDARFFGSRRRGRESSSYISPSDDRTIRDQY